jgi:glycosyltransferase involved in cell wall biosynthesis
MLKNNLTVIIPCKNEGINIYDCINLLSRQEYILDTNVIIADTSDDQKSINWLTKTQSDFKHLLNIHVIKGGFPAKARLEGSKLATTPYILFLDADIMLLDKFVLGECLTHNTDLVTVPFQTEKEFNWIFRLFDIQQRFSNWLGTPFAVGGFQLWKTESYWKAGGYNETHLFAEDYWISQKTEIMKIHNTKGVWTSARRFKNKGFFYMAWLTIKCYFNRNNPEFFKKSHNYWN